MGILEDKKDTGDNKYDLMKRLDEFRNKVKNDKNTVDFFSDLSELKYSAFATLKNAIEYADDNSGWVRYTDVADVINEEVKGRSIASTGLSEQQQKTLEELKDMLIGFGSRLTEIENNQLSWEEMPVATKEDINNLFCVENGILIIGNGDNSDSAVGQDDVGNIPVDSAFLLVYAASDNGQIIKTQSLGAPVQVSTAGKQFMADESQRESARWVEALDRLISWGWVKPMGYKGQILN